MTFENELQPGQFPERFDYARLVSLAKRRLGGLEHHAEDVVSLALMKWARISTDRRGVARIEQVIKTEAYSFIRSERRARDRDTRAVNDRGLVIGGTERPHSDYDIVVLREALAETIRKTGATVTAVDLEVFELLVAGCSPSDIVRRTDLTRHQVRRSRLAWQELLRRTLAEPAPTRSSAPQA
ncbi:MAG: hypothetical protein ACR2QO_15010 [Acidimicrobiales bacterium]